MSAEPDAFAEEPSRLRAKVLSLDQQAQAELVRELNEFAAFVLKVEAESAERMAKTGEKPTKMKIGMSAFPLPRRPET